MVDMRWAEKQLKMIPKLQSCQWKRVGSVDKTLEWAHVPAGRRHSMFLDRRPNQVNGENVLLCGHLRTKSGHGCHTQQCESSQSQECLAQ